MTQLPFVIDIEASGFGSGSYPIEIGVALSDGRLLSRLIKPMDHWVHWQDSAEKLHGISRERLCDEGCDPHEVAAELNELLHDQTVYTDGWGVDRGWLALLFYECGMAQRFKLEAIFRLLNEPQLESWAKSRELVVKQSGLVPHRAGSDALLVQDTYIYTTDPEFYEEHRKPSATRSSVA